MKNKVKYSITDHPYFRYWVCAIVIIVLFLGSIGVIYHHTHKKIDSLVFQGKSYYPAPYLMVNSTGQGKNTKIFGTSSYLGDKQNQDSKDKMTRQFWEIATIPKQKMIVEMTPGEQSVGEQIWCNQKLTHISEVFDFLNPKFVTYASYDHGDLKLQQVATEKQQELMTQIKKLVNTNPDFKRSSSLEGESINEIYMNEDIHQSICLQASVLKLNNGKNYITFSGGNGQKGYWLVNKELSDLLH